MKPFSLVTAAIAAAFLALVPGSAAAKIVQLGQTATPISAPQCPKGTSPSKCFIILTRTTAVQTTSDGIKNPTVVKKDGWIVVTTSAKTGDGVEKAFLQLAEAMVAAK